MVYVFGEEGAGTQISVLLAAFVIIISHELLL